MRWRPVAWRCRDRACPGCFEARHLRFLLPREIVIDAARARGSQVALVTLTQRRDSAEDAAQARSRLETAWRRLRRRRAFAKMVAGYVVRIEGAYDDTLGWHEHAHVIVVGRCLDAQVLVRAWRGATRDAAARVDVSTIEEGDTGNVLAYLSKPPVTTAEEILLRADAMRGRRHAACGGTLRTVRRTTTTADVEPARQTSRDGELFVSLGQLRHSATCGAPWARRVLSALNARTANGTYRASQTWTRATPRPVVPTRAAVPDRSPAGSR